MGRETSQWRDVAWIRLSTLESIENNDTIKIEITIVRKGLRVSRLGYPPLNESVYGFFSRLYGKDKEVRYLAHSFSCTSYNSFNNTPSHDKVWKPAPLLAS